MEGSLSEQEIDALRERWQAEKTPALTLQLADAYRRRDQPARALEVLEAALEASPDHRAARVAKGRCHLDLDDAEAARAELSRVVISDPTHLLANKLLVEVHTRLGESQRARDRLDLFALLSGELEQVAELERLLGGEAADTGGTAAAPDEADGPLELPVAEAPDDVDAPLEMPVVEAPDEADTPLEVPAAAPDQVDEPFELPTAAAPGDVAEPFDLPAAEALGALEMESPGPTLPGPSAPRSGARHLEVEPFALDEPDLANYREALLSEGVFSRPVAWNGADSAAAGSEPAADAAPPTPTLTLGELYRKQGHYAEAAGIFRDVLEREPGNPQAARALVDLEKEQGWPLSAEDLLGGAGDPNAAGRIRSARDVLKRYRDRLRGEG